MFLLLVFSLNTVVGFACAMGWNINFATSHHKGELLKPLIHTHSNGKQHHHLSKPEKASVHSHPDGKNRHHQHEPVKAPTHVHKNGKKHEHKNEAVYPHHKEKETSKNGKDDCCNDEVIKFQNLDKSLSQNARITNDVLVFIAILGIFPGFDVVKLSKSYPAKYKARFFYPPPPDIRIAIQSFQI